MTERYITWKKEHKDKMYETTCQWAYNSNARKCQAKKENIIWSDVHYCLWYYIFRSLFG